MAIAGEANQIFRPVTMFDHGIDGEVEFKNNDGKARPTMSLSLYIQQGGRVLRPYPGKTDALILDHAANVLTHGKLEAFEPPTDLGLIDKRTDRKTRRDPHSAWVCRECEATNDLTTDVCVECGTPRYRHTRVLLLDGELVEHHVEREDDPLPAPTLEQVRDFYLQARWYATSKGMQSPAGWAFHATRRRYRLDESAGRRVIAWSWRDLKTTPPDDEAAQWFRAGRHRRPRHGPHHPAACEGRRHR